MGTTTLRSAVRGDTLSARPRAEADPLGSVGHNHYWERALSRGALMKGAGALAAASLLLPGMARAGGGVAAATPRPIPPNPDFFGLHVYFPVEGSEPATIFDFNGFCGVTELQGTGTLTMDGHTTQAFFDVDNRFMTGEYVGADGRMHHGTFGFIWLDVFTDAGLATQVMDFNPGVVVDSGLFWTTAIPDNAVDAHPGAGTGRYALSDFAVPDYHDGFNSVVGGPHDPGVVSFDIRWAGSGQSTLQTDGSSFSFDAVVSSATVEWEGLNETSGAHFVTDARATSHSLYAAVGHLKNGVFYRP